MANLSAIQKELLATDDAKRIVINCRTNHLDAGNYRSSVYEIVSEVFPEWEHDPRILFLAIEIWSERTFIVVDINRNDYNYDTAHKCKNILPVYVLRKHGKPRRWVLIRWPQQDESLMRQIADLHNVNGFDVATPFLENHNLPIFHSNPREFPMPKDPQ